MHAHSHTGHADKPFPTDTTGLEPATETETVEIPDGGAFDLRIAPVKKQLGGATVRMLAYNGSVPGPTLKVAQGSEVTVRVENRGDLEATVHWHGLRLDNRYDGTHETQRPMEIGESFEYRLQFPDEGLYWFHPHIRQDYGQEMGLYGTILVVPEDPGYWAPAHRELVVTLDDILIEDGQVAPFSPTETTYAAMGRFGNQLLVNGEPSLVLDADAGEVVRLYLVNTANTRVFNVAVRGGRMKLVGGDSGRCEREELVESVVLAPSERAVVDVRFDAAGEAALEHRTPERTYPLAAITVGDRAVDPGPTAAFDTLRVAPEMVAERHRIAPHRDREPDKTIAFVAEMEFEVPEGAVVYSCPMHPEVVSLEDGKCPECGMKLMPTAGVVAYTCPMHPDVISATEGKCPECGMKLMPAAGAPLAFTCPMHPDVVSDEQGKCPHCGMKLMPASAVSAAAGESHDHEHHAMDHDVHEQHEHGEHAGPGHHHDHAAAGGIEWEDDMVEVNRTTTPANTRWKLIDRSTGAENHGVAWRFKVGDRVKIRLVNEMDSDHPMHHPFHIHGAGRFLVLSRDGVEDPNLVWTDTVLVRTGEVVDILLDVTHPGRWMAHCHIAEHHESGMMFSFDVDPADAARRRSPTDRGDMDTTTTPTTGDDAAATLAPAAAPTMRAIVRDRYGSADVLAVREVEVPDLDHGEVLVRVRAAGLDRGAWHIMAGLPYLMRIAGYGVRRPRTAGLGTELAGVVESVGADVAGLRPGDRVYGTSAASFAEYAVARADRLARMPTNLTFEQAAAVPVSAVTALQALRDHGHLQARQRVLVVGASGGVGTFAVQIAKALAAEVTAVCSTAKVDLVRSIGADHVIDYTRGDITDGVRRYELVLDIGGNRPLSQLRRALTRHGTLVIVGGEGGDRWTGGIHRQLRAMALSPFARQRLGTLIAKQNSADLDALRELIESGAVTPVIDRVVTLDQVPDAIRDLAAGHARGKIVLAP